MSDTKSDAGKKLELDFDAFELEIDREIDSLLVPLAESPAVIVPEEASPGAQPKEGLQAQADLPERSAESAAGDILPLADSSTAGVARVQILQDASPSGMDSISGTREDLQETEDRERSELPKLMESFRVAYLSLDWDFSVQNLTELDESLERLQRYCNRVSEAQTIYKILKVMLQRLKARPDIASAQVVELIRGSQDLLARILEGGAGVAEKEETRRLFQQVQSIRRSIASGEESGPEKRSGQEVAELSELRDWMESSAGRLSDVMEGLEEEKRRIQQIIEVLEKKPALAPLTARISGIRTNLEAHLRSICTL